MKSSLFSRLMILMTAVLLSTGAFAAGPVHKGSLEITDTVLVNGTELQPGTYTVLWDGDGPEASLRIMQGKKEVANTTCKVVALDQKAPQDAAELRADAEGKQLRAVRFAGQKYELEIAGESGQGQTKGNTVK